MEKIKTTILLVDDHTVVRQGIEKLLEMEPDFKIIGHAENGREALKKVEKLRPDIVLMDISMPLLNGIEATRRIKKISPDTKLVILSMHSHNRYISELFCIGISGYLLKSASGRDITEAIKAAVRGDTFLSPSISRQVIDDYVCLKKERSVEDHYQKLSNREREVFQLIAEGRTTGEISDILCISPSTVKTHRSNIMKKLELENSSQIIRYAIGIGIIEVDS